VAQQIGCDPATGISNGHARRASDATRTDLNRPAGISELERVRQYIQEHLAKPIRIPHHPDGRIDGGHPHGDVLHVRRGFHRIDGAADDVRQVGW
jgi:hypothetical protein